MDKFLQHETEHVQEEVRLLKEIARLRELLRECRDDLEKIKNMLAAPRVKYLGWANSWTHKPDIITKCKVLGHMPNETSAGPLTHTVRCDICGYYYKYDSS